MVEVEVAQLHLRPGRVLAGRRTRADGLDHRPAGGGNAAVQLEQVRGAGVGRQVGLGRQHPLQHPRGPRRSDPARRWRPRSHPVRTRCRAPGRGRCRPSRSAPAKSCRDIASEPRPASAAASRGASSTARSSSRLALVYQVGSPSSRAICSSAKARLSYAEGSRGAAASAAVKRSICDRVLSPGEGSGATSGAAAARSACVGSGCDDALPWRATATAIVAAAPATRATNAGIGFAIVSIMASKVGSGGGANDRAPAWSVMGWAAGGSPRNRCGRCRCMGTGP